MRLLSYEVQGPFGPAVRVGAESADGRVLDLSLAFELML